MDQPGQAEDPRSACALMLVSELRTLFLVPDETMMYRQFSPAGDPRPTSGASVPPPSVGVPPADGVGEPEQPQPAVGSAPHLVCDDEIPDTCNKKNDIMENADTSTRFTGPADNSSSRHNS